MYTYMNVSIVFACVIIAPTFTGFAAFELLIRPEAGNITPASSTDHKRKGAYALFKKSLKIALGCMAIRTQTELMIRQVQFIRRTKEAATQAACARNTRGYHSVYGNS